MIQLRSIIGLADNSGARKLRCIRVHGGYQKRYGRLGDIITASVIEATPHASVHKGEVVHAVIARTKKETLRADGSVIRFDENAAILIDLKSKEPRASRIFGPVGRELKTKGFTRIASLAPEVI